MGITLISLTSLKNLRRSNVIFASLGSGREEVLQVRDAILNRLDQWEIERQAIINHNPIQPGALRSIENARLGQGYESLRVSNKSGPRDSSEDLSCRSDHDEDRRSRSLVEDVQNPPILLGVRQSPRNSVCRCRCHRQGHLKSPRSLSAILGSFFLGYQAIPCSAETCKYSSCQRRSGKVNYTYAFPRWLLSRVLLINIGYSRSRGPELILRTMRIRPDRESMFRVMIDEYADESKILSRIETLIDEGAGSILDVSPDGMTGLHVSS